MTRNVDVLSSLLVFPFAAHSLVPFFPLSDWRNVTRTNSPVSKPFALVALKGVALDHRSKNGQYLRFRNVFALDLVQSLPVVATTEKHQVGPRSLAHECDLCNIWPSAAVGTSSHAHDD